MSHWLDRLLSPKTIAIVGASAREGSLATTTYRQLIERKFKGNIFLINPKYDELFNQRCYESLQSLPEVPDLVVFVISGLGLEKSFESASQMGVGGIVMYASNYFEEDADIPLPERLKHKAIAAGVPVIGGNSMGYYNYDDDVFVSFDCPPKDRPAGHIGLIAHSGSAMTYLANNDARFCFNYVISSGQETNASVADYIDYLLAQSSTKVIALFLESVRNVTDFIAALKKARQQNIAIVIIKLGRTEKSAELAVSHSGAIAGNHDAFIALCQRYGVILVNDIDELMVTAMLIATCGKPASGGVASLLDSGGMREQMIDIADDYGLRFAQISNETKTAMRHHLEHGLIADNPLDAMGALGRNTEQTYLECGKALLNDKDTGLLTYEFEFRDGFTHYPQMYDVINGLVQYSQKPLIVINSFTFSSLTQTAVSMTWRGIPVISGIDLALRSIKNYINYYAQSSEEFDQFKSTIDSTNVERWKVELADSPPLDEFNSLELLSDFGFPIVQYSKINRLDLAISKANELSYPVVLKTAEPGIQHKSELGGVKLDIENDQQLSEAYIDLNAHLGSNVLVMPMAPQGVELAIGMKNDAQYGPLLIVSAGGILIELINDRAFALTPVNHKQAESILNQLKINKLLNGVRGKPAVDVKSLLELIVNFSDFVYNFSDSIAEIDLNPVIVHEQGCSIVDALIVPKASRNERVRIS